jgi:hypothetical protein
MNTIFGHLLHFVGLLYTHRELSIPLYRPIIQSLKHHPILGTLGHGPYIYPALAAVKTTTAQLL